MVFAEFHVRLVEGNPYEIKMAGAIDERADFSLAFAPPNVDLKIDMAHVTFIKPAGIREFRDWIHKLANANIVLLSCPRALVNMINMSANLLPHQCRVDSFYVPYRSDTTDEEMSVLFRRNVDFKVENNQLVFMWPDVRDSTGQPMEIDAIQERYFQFLTLTPVPAEATGP